MVPRYPWVGKTMEGATLMAFHMFFLNQSSKKDAEAMGERNKALLGVVLALKVHELCDV